MLNQNIYITYSNQKARELNLDDNIDVFSKITTLDSLIFDLFEANNLQTIIDESIGGAIVYKIISEHNIQYFSYLDSDAISLKTIWSFIVKCNRNNVEYNQIVDGKKLTAIITINKYYQEYKKQFNLVDIADVEKIVYESFDLKYFDSYITIFIDDFQVGNINYLKSNYQEKIYQQLLDINISKKFNNITVSNRNTKIMTISNEVFDSIDEVKNAIKLIRFLLKDESNKPDDILMVASDINEYAPLYKLFLDEYKLKGYSSTGTPLSSFYNDSDPRIKSALNSYKSQLNTTEKLYTKLGLTFTDKVKENLKSNIKISDERIGIEITEPNQISGLNKTYKHIIFIGTDINHFPLKSSDNFLYSYEDEIRYFYMNNYFTDAQTQYSELKRLSENLYVITASHSGKREISRSILIENSFAEKIDLSDIRSSNDITLDEQAVIDSVNTKIYFNSITKSEFTQFDGANVEDIHATYLSASQINSYNSCPLSYLYKNKVKIKAPRQNEEGFDAMEQGSLMHLCFELFGKSIKNHHIMTTDLIELSNLMYEKSIEAYNHKDTREPMGKDIMVENIHHQIFLSNLQAGLKDTRSKGLLAKFVDYYIKHAEQLKYFKNTEFEKEFILDNDLKPYELKSNDDKNYFIKGFIDRFDNLDDHINVIDYKSKKMSSNIDKDKQEEITTLKDVQLALYILYSSQAYPDKDYKAHLLTFKGDNLYYNFANLSTIDEKDTVLYNEEYANKLREVIYGTKAKIEAGNFTFDSSDEKYCGYCDFKHMCHSIILNKIKKI
jgi:hypothetical protein